uniref:Uncharacterized protein LOC114336225 n=1 Tax=Diabrotica virgifera virgifera TaxID=50390 RepID=A0A6P7G0K3_DIAVI
MWEEYCRAAEISSIQVKEIRNDMEVDFVRYSNKKSMGRSSNRQGDDVYKCFKCGTTHGKMNCPAYGKNCQNCGKLNHYAVGCKFNKRQVGSDQAGQSNSRYHSKSFGYKNNNPLRKNVHEVDNESSDEDVSLCIDYLTIDSVDNNNNKAWYVQAQINNQVVSLKLDTGASCNCMPLSLFNKLNLNKNKIDKSSVTIVSYGNNKVKTVGSIIIKCLIKSAFYNIKFLLVEEASVPIL